MKKIKVMIIDDHSLVRQGLRNLIEEEDTFSVCCEAENHRESMELMAEYRPDLAIVDLSLPDGSGLDLVRRATVKYPYMFTLVCSMHKDEQYLERSLRAGAHGFINKQEAGEQIISAIKQVVEGNIYRSEEIEFSESNDPAENNVRQGQKGIENLSNRELEVFELIGYGLSTREIAKSLNLSVKTIGSHRDNIKAKLGLRTGSELTCNAVLWSVGTESVDEYSIHGEDSVLGLTA